MLKLTEMEKKVLAALIDSADGNGMDFGFVEDARGLVSVASLGGVVASLSTKGLIRVFPTEDFGDGPCTQVYINGVSEGSLRGSYDAVGVAARLAELQKACE